MRLLTKSSYYFIVTSIVIFLLSGITIYFLIDAIVEEDIDEYLDDQRKEVIWEIKKNNGFENFIIPKDSTVLIGPVLSKMVYQEPIYEDTLKFNTVDEEPIPMRKLTFTYAYNGEFRNIFIYRSLIESDDLIEGIIYSLLIVFAITVISIIGLNYLGMHKLWQPFRTILEQIKIFDFRTSDGFQQVNTDISEFVELNNELTKMTAKLTHDYFSLKEFSENASHEMQTPLAIIQAKLELLLQQKDLNEENLKAINSAYQAANRLSRLHHELNLLTRIENKEFTEKSSVALKPVLEQQLENFSDIIEMKELNLTTRFKADPVVPANAYLLEILFSNLINNAIKHNIAKGEINIELNEDSFIISNSGVAPSDPPEMFFERFKKGKASSDSVGLGLSLVKQISLFHDLNITYSFTNQLHIIKLSF